MSDHSDDVSKHIRGYLIIGGTLIIGTVLTVLASYVDLGHHWNVVLALVIDEATLALWRSRFTEEQWKTFQGEGPSWQEQVIARGWGHAELAVSSVQADTGDGLAAGIIGLANHGQERQPDDWGALRAWAWSARAGRPAIRKRGRRAQRPGTCPSGPPIGHPRCRWR